MRLSKVMYLFQNCWDDRKYQDKVDSNTGARADGEQGQAEEAGAEADCDEEGYKFHAKMLTNSIKNPLFSRYLYFVNVLESITQQDLASWAEGCICHGGSMDHGMAVGCMGRNERERMMELHFENKRCSCPMAGKKAPEISAGKLHDLLGRIWDISTHDILFGDEVKNYPVGQDSLAVLQEDLQQASLYMTGLLNAKCDDYKKDCLGFCLHWLYGMKKKPEGLERKH